MVDRVLRLVNAVRMVAVSIIGDTCCLQEWYCHTQTLVGTEKKHKNHLVKFW